MPKVSIVVPFYNTPTDFFREALDSVLSQTFGDWELLLVDDGSTDPSREVAEAFASECERARVLHHPGRRNRGISATRALGAAHAQGDVIALLDADDVWLPRKLECQVAALEAHPRAAMVYGMALYWHSWNAQATTEDHVPPLAFPADRLLEPPGPLPHFLTGRAAVPAPCSVLVRSAALDAVGGFEDPATQGAYEDQIFYAKLCLAYPVLPHGDVLERYRLHPESLTGLLTAGEAVERRRAYLAWLDEYLGTSARPAPVDHALRRENWLLDHPRSARVLRTLRRLPDRLRRLVTPSRDSSFPRDRTGVRFE